MGDSEFSRLNRERDLAAYYVVGVLQGALSFWEVNDFETSRGMLQRALDHFRAVDGRLTTAAEASTSIPPQPVSPKENSADGNRTAA